MNHTHKILAGHRSQIVSPKPELKTPNPKPPTLNLKPLLTRDPRPYNLSP